MYRAGTNGNPPSGLEQKSEVWLLKDPRLYYPLHQDKNAKTQDHRQRKGGSDNVSLWRAVIDPSKLHLQVEDHPKFKDVCLVTLGPVIASLPWEKAEVPECHGGMSFIDFGPLLQAIVEYMKDNYPSTPEEFNFQAELKVVSHWHWPDDEEVVRRTPGFCDDFRIKKAVKATLHKWCKDLRDLQSKISDASLKEDISELEEDETEDKECSLDQRIDESDDDAMDMGLTEEIRKSREKEDLLLNPIAALQEEGKANPEAREAEIQQIKQHALKRSKF